jgi:exodeoxyribonuclease-3
LAAGFTDVFRQQNPGLAKQYTWWSYRSAARERNVGWRIDYHCATPGLAGRLGKAFHLNQVMGSDHCPIGLELKD